MSLPLAGIRVLDLSNVIAGPLASYQLALMGAEVIKIEVPGIGDLARKMGADLDAGRRQMGMSYLAFNANKKSLTLNLKNEKGKAVFRKLVLGADVVLENFRPGAMDRLGLSAEALRALNPRLIYCAVSGFGRTGPLAQRASYDQIIQGYWSAIPPPRSPPPSPSQRPWCDGTRPGRGRRSTFRCWIPRSAA
jgi:crotonobetainyl-CoA:carnitine CoA-transferase CaiB-like acyl-CoA transferase